MPSTSTKQAIVPARNVYFEFAADADPEVGAHNVAELIRYAFILQNHGEAQGANNLLDMAIAWD